MGASGRCGRDAERRQSAGLLAGCRYDLVWVWGRCPKQKLSHLASVIPVLCGKPVECPVVRPPRRRRWRFNAASPAARSDGLLLPRFAFAPTEAWSPRRTPARRPNAGAGHPARRRDVRRDGARAAAHGFDPNVAILFGIGIAGLLRRRGGRVPSYLGSASVHRGGDRRHGLRRQRPNANRRWRSAGSSPRAPPTRSSALS